MGQQFQVPAMYADAQWTDLEEDTARMAAGVDYSFVKEVVGKAVRRVADQLVSCELEATRRQTIKDLRAMGFEDLTSALPDRLCCQVWAWAAKTWEKAGTSAPKERAKRWPAKFLLLSAMRVALRGIKTLKTEAVGWWSAELEALPERVVGTQCGCGAPASFTCANLMHCEPCALTGTSSLRRCPNVGCHDCGHSRGTFAKPLRWC